VCSSDLAFRGCDEVGFPQFFGAFGIQLCQFEGGFGVRQFCIGLLDSGPISSGINLSDDLSLSDHRIKVDIDLANHARDLATHLNTHHGVELSARGYGLREITAGYRSGSVFRRLLRMLLVIVPPAPAQTSQD